MSLNQRLDPTQSVTERLLQHGWVEIHFDVAGWLDIDCLWCGTHAGHGYLQPLIERDETAVVTCPQCGREMAIIREVDCRPIAQKLMSPADLAYLRWRTEQGRPATWSELTP